MFYIITLLVYLLEYINAKMLTKSKMPNKGPKINSPFSSFDLCIHHRALSFSLSMLNKYIKHYSFAIPDYTNRRRR